MRKFWASKCELAQSFRIFLCEILVAVFVKKYSNFMKSEDN